MLNMQRTNSNLKIIVILAVSFSTVAPTVMANDKVGGLQGKHLVVALQGQVIFYSYYCLYEYIL